MKSTKASWTEVGVAGLRKARSVQVATPAAPNSQSLAFNWGRTHSRQCIGAAQGETMVWPVTCVAKNGRDREKQGSFSTRSTGDING